MKTKSLTAAGAALMLTLAGFGLAGPAAGAPDKSANTAGSYTSCEGLLGTGIYVPADEWECPPLEDSANGQGKAPHLAGSKGKADDKNPPGQLKNGEPGVEGGNQGYECEDGQNKGVGNGNPAHSGCAVPKRVQVPQ